MRRLLLLGACAVLAVTLVAAASPQAERCWWWCPEPPPQPTVTADPTVIPTIAPPVLAGKVWAAPVTVTTQELQAAIADLTISTIALPASLELAKGQGGDGPAVRVTRTTPLLIRPADGVAKSIFHGTAGLIYYDGQFSWSGAAAITMQDVGFEDYTLSQAGIHGISGTTGLSLLRQSVSRITLSPTTTAYKSWFAYVTGARNDDLVIEVDATGFGGKNLSAVQVASTTTAQGNITVKILGKDLAFAFYGEPPIANLTLDADLDNVERNGVSIRFAPGEIGTYRALLGNGSGAVNLNGSQMVAP